MQMTVLLCKFSFCAPCEQIFTCKIRRCTPLRAAHAAHSHGTALCSFYLSSNKSHSHNNTTHSTAQRNAFHIRICYYDYYLFFFSFACFFHFEKKKVRNKHNNECYNLSNILFELKDCWRRRSSVIYLCT